MISSFSIFWWFSDFEQNGYLNRNTAIFSDIVLPDGRGPELLEEILKLKPKIGVLLTSGYSDEKLDWGAIRKGDYHYLQKPYSLSDLLRVVRDALKIKRA